MGARSRFSVEKLFTLKMKKGHLTVSEGEGGSRAFNTLIHNVVEREEGAGYAPQAAHCIKL